MLAENPAQSSRRGFVGLAAANEDADAVVFELDFPEGCANRSVGSSGTWLITVDEKLDMHLRNPFTRDQLELPSLSGLFHQFEERSCKKYGDDYDEDDAEDEDEEENGEEEEEEEEEEKPLILYLRDSFMKRAVLRWLPSSSDDDQKLDFVVLAINSCNYELAFTRRGSELWTTIEMDFPHMFRDVIFYKAKGRFYGVTYKGVVLECDIDGGHPKVIQVSSPLKKADLQYLVELSGQLLQVLRIIDDDCITHKTIQFEVYVLDFDTGEWTELKHLGRHSLFLGDNASVALLPDDNSSFNGNCIYFTDNFRLGFLGNDWEGGKDMGVFDLEDGSIKPHYKGVSLSYFSPPLWIIPNDITSS